MKTISAHEKEKLLSVFLEQLLSFQEQDSITIGLSGGTSLLSFYETLREYFPSLDEEIRAKIRFSFLDERLVPLNHPESNYRLLSECFLTPLLEKHLIKKEQILAVRTDIMESANEYSLRVPFVNIGLFGAGPDGHIASLFPNHPALQDTSEWYILVHNSPKPPSNRVSISVSFAQKIPSIFIFFIGEGKREAYTHFLDINVAKEQCPAKYLLGCKECSVVTDLK